MRGLQLLLQDETISPSLASPDHIPTIASTFDGPSLTGGQPTAVPLFGTQRVKTAEIVAPSSITEHTTNLLENK